MNNHLQEFGKSCGSVILVSVLWVYKLLGSYKSEC